MRRKHRWWIKTMGDVPDERKVTLKSQDGPVGENWHSLEFIRVMETIAEKKRLSRGITCARARDASKLTFEPGYIRIGISCSGYTIRDVVFYVSKFSKEEWEQMVGIIAADTALTGALISGDFSERFVMDVRKHGIDLLPSAYKIYNPFCGCGDSYEPCIHVIAAWYFIAEALDTNPWNLLYIRGKTRQELIQEVNRYKPAPTTRSTEPAKASLPALQVSDILPYSISVPSSASPQGYFACIGSEPLSLTDDEQMVFPVRLLGSCPYWLGGKNLADLIEKLYPHISSSAKRIFSEDNDQTDSTE